MPASGSLIVWPSGRISFPRNAVVVASKLFRTVLVDHLELLRERRIIMKYSHPTCWLPYFHINVRICCFLFSNGVADLSSMAITR